MNASSLVLAPVGRLLWKEYRAQRLLWGVLLGFGIGLQVLFRIAFSEEARLGGTEAGLVGSLAVMGFVIALVFAAASAAISFAGEREDRTCDWLLQMACNPGWMLIAKCGFLVTASLLQALILITNALMLVNLGSHRPEGIDVPRLSLVFVGVVVWSILGSLLSRRVVASIPTMFFCWFLTMLGPIICVPWLF